MTLLRRHQFSGNQRCIKSTLIVAAVIVALLSGQVDDARGYDNYRINSDTTSQLQNEQQIVVSPTNDSVVIGVWRDFRLGYRRVGVGVSNDAGKTWSDSLISTTPLPWDSDPVISYASDGSIYATTLGINDDTNVDHVYVLKSIDNGQSWGTPVAATPAPPGHNPDKQWIAVDRSGGIRDGAIYISYSDFSIYPRPIRLVGSFDGGASFVEPITINIPNRVQWSVPVVGKDGLVFVAWVCDNPPSIRCMRLPIDGPMDSEWILFETAFYFTTLSSESYKVYPYPAMDADLTGGPNHGYLYMTFIDRRLSGDCDLFFSRSVDDGLHWSSPVRINDDSIGNGAEQFHPWISVNPDGAIIIVFLDQRVPPESVYYMNLFVTSSFDGGQTFTPNQRVSTVSSDLRTAKVADFQESKGADSDRLSSNDRAGLLGEYIGVSANSHTAHAIWTDTRNGHQDAYTAAIPIGYHPPELAFPEDSVVLYVNPSHFMWAPVLSSDSMPVCRLEVAEDSAFSSLVTSVDGLISNYYLVPSQPTLEPGRYYWRVIDSLPNGKSGRSDSYRVFSISCCTLRGDVDANESVDVADLTYIVDYLFRSGLPPVCPEEADMDADSGVNVSDLSYIVDYLFRGGPPPVDCS